MKLKLSLVIFVFTFFSFQILAQNEVGKDKLTLVEKTTVTYSSRGISTSTSTRSEMYYTIGDSKKKRVGKNYENIKRYFRECDPCLEHYNLCVNECLEQTKYNWYKLGATGVLIVGAIIAGKSYLNSSSDGDGSLPIATYAGIGIGVAGFAGYAVYHLKSGKCYSRAQNHAIDAVSSYNEYYFKDEDEDED